MVTDAKEEPKDAIQEAGQDSAEQQRDSKKAKLYTEDEVEKKFSSQRSALDKKIAELTKATTSATSLIKEAEARASAAEQALEKAERAKDEAEYERVRGNPDALTDFQAKKAIKEAQEQLRKERADIARSKAEHADELKEIASWKTERAAREIADKHKGVDYKDLIELTDGSPEKMEKMAAKLATIKVAETPKEVKEPEEENEPDSGDGKGNSGESFKDDEPMEQYAARRKDAYK
jgi:chromosome segregation ATPase